MIFFASFCRFWDSLLEVLKSKKNLWLRPLERLDKYKNFVCLKYYFQKKNSKYEILNNLYFDSNFAFFGTAIGPFSQCFVLIFRRRPTIMTDIFTQPPTIKKLPTVLVLNENVMWNEMIKWMDKWMNSNSDNFDRSTL